MISFRNIADISHVLSVLSIPVNIQRTRSCEGISARSQILFAVVFTARYLDLFTNYISLYNTVMKITFLTTTYITVYLMFFKFRSTYMRESDTCRAELLIIPSAVLALFIEHEILGQFVWWISVVTQSVALIPQIVVTRRMGGCSAITIFTTTCGSFYRVFYWMHWAKRSLSNEPVNFTFIILFMAENLLYIYLIYLLHWEQRTHQWLPLNNSHRQQRPMIRPSSVVSLSMLGRSIEGNSENDVDEEMGGMSLDSPIQAEELPNRPFPDKPYYWMNDQKTLEYIQAKFSHDPYYVMHDGKIVESFENFIREHNGNCLVKYSFHLRIRGGKGGFGSLLRSFRVNKSTNKLMMRDLNGRRMASVDEEAKLKRYLEKQARKEQEMKEKRQAKLAKLTAGPANHQFEDQAYLSRREEIIEKTEDACEAGFALMKELQRKSRMSREQVKETDREEEDDQNAEDVTDLFNERSGRKRKIDAPTVGEVGEKKRIEDESDESEYDSENEPDEEELQAIRQYFEEKQAEEKKIGEGTSSEVSEEKVEKEEEPEPAKRPRLDSASNVDDLPKIDEKTPCEYGPIDLTDFTSAEDLELLGLEHLKSALTDRGLKCGGSLSERAARLWSIKGKELRDWPKSILTPELKKKVAEEEEAAKKAAKKAKKSKK